MYAVVDINSTQVLVEKGDNLKVNRIKNQKSKVMKIKNVLFGKKGSSHFVGSPYVKNAYVECEVLRDSRAKKVIVFKYRDRKSSQSKRGHRQNLTELKVKDIHFE